MLATALADAVRHLTSIGLVDETKVGLMGHSAAGRVVEQALLESDFPYAAAIAADCAELNYLQSALGGWSYMPGAPAPFGEGLKFWMDNSPAFNAERITTPLQLEVTTGGRGFGTLLWEWELFSRLRYLSKPVEYYILPDITGGRHLLQNPRQLLALQSRALDWWSFWLKGEESLDPTKAEQYLEWKRLRELHNAELSRPRPARRNWSFISR
jgi:hypothetical protein